MNRADPRAPAKTNATGRRAEKGWFFWVIVRQHPTATTAVAAAKALRYRKLYEISAQACPCARASSMSFLS